MSKTILNSRVKCHKYHFCTRYKQKLSIDQSHTLTVSVLVFLIWASEAQEFQFVGNYVKFDKTFAFTETMSWCCCHVLYFVEFVVFLLFVLATKKMGDYFLYFLYLK